MKTITFLIAFAIPFYGLSQIEVKKAKEENPFEKIENKILTTPYDSLQNEPLEKIGGFIGQRLLMNQRDNKAYSDFDKDTYYGFFIDIHSEPQVVYKGIKSEIYTNKIKTSIDSVYGKYFTCIGYDITKVKSSYSDKFNIYIKLTDENNDTLYFEYLKNVSTSFYNPDKSFPFITEGYYIKSIKDLKGKKVKKGLFMYDCIDVFVEEGNNYLTYRLKDDDGKVEDMDYSEYSKIRGFKQYTFEYDSTYLLENNSTFAAVTKNKSQGFIDIFTRGTEIVISIFATPNNCFSKDDVVVLEMSDEIEAERYYKGKFNCKGNVYISIDITSENDLNLFNQLINYDLLSVMIISDYSDYVLLSPNNYSKVKDALKAHYMSILND